MYVLGASIWGKCEWKKMSSKWDRTMGEFSAHHHRTNKIAKQKTVLELAPPPTVSPTNPPPQPSSGPLGLACKEHPDRIVCHLQEISYVGAARVHKKNTSPNRFSAVLEISPPTPQRLLSKQRCLRHS